MEFSVHRLGAPTMRAITRWSEAAAVTSGPLTRRSGTGLD